MYLTASMIEYAFLGNILVTGSINAPFAFSPYLRERTSKVRFFVFGDQPRCAIFGWFLGNVNRSLYSLVQGLEVCLVKADN